MTLRKQRGRLAVSGTLLAVVYGAASQVSHPSLAVGGLTRSRLPRPAASIAAASTARQGASSSPARGSGARSLHRCHVAPYTYAAQI